MDRRVLALTAVFVAGCLGPAGIDTPSPGTCTDLAPEGVTPFTRAPPAAPRVELQEVRQLSDGLEIRVRVCFDAPRASEDSWRPVVSDDGRFVAFDSKAWNLVPESVPREDPAEAVVKSSTLDLPGSTTLGGVFLRDLHRHTTTLVSIDSDGHAVAQASSASLSGDGRRVAFAGRSSDGHDSVFVRDVSKGTTREIRQASDAGQCHDREPWLSGDGGVLAFTERCDRDGASDVYVLRLDDATSAPVLASRNEDGQGGSAEASRPRLDDEGRVVVFNVRRDEIAVNTEGVYDAMLMDIETLAMQRICPATTPQTRQPEDAGPLGATNPDISGDGRFVVVETTAALDANDDPRTLDVYRLDRDTGLCELASRDARGARLFTNYFVGGMRPAISRDGSTIAVGLGVWTRETAMRMLDPVPQSEQPYPNSWLFSFPALDAHGDLLVLTVASLGTSNDWPADSLVAISTKGDGTEVAQVDVPVDAPVETRILVQGLTAQGGSGSTQTMAVPGTGNIVLRVPTDFFVDGTTLQVNVSAIAAGASTNLRFTWDGQEAFPSTGTTTHRP